MILPDFVLESPHGLDVLRQLLNAFRTFEDEFAYPVLQLIECECQLLIERRWELRDPKLLHLLDSFLYPLIHLLFGDHFFDLLQQNRIICRTSLFIILLF